MPQYERGYRVSQEVVKKRNKTRQLRGWFRNPEEISKKFSLSRVGKAQTEETKKKRIISLKKTYQRKLKNGERWQSDEGRKKLSISHLQEKNPNWQDGKTELVKLIRALPRYKSWREAIFKRDNYTCQDCKKHSDQLQPHHVIPLSKLLKEKNIKTMEQALDCIVLWDISNGLTLCRPCHKKTDTFGSKAKKHL